MRYSVGSCPICSVVYDEGYTGFVSERTQRTGPYSVLSEPFSATVVRAYIDHTHDEIRVGWQWSCELINMQGVALVHVPFGGDIGCYLLPTDYFQLPPKILGMICALIPKEDDLFLDA